MSLTLFGGVTQSGLHGFGYAAIHQLTSADHPAVQVFNPDETFGYDLVGNRNNTGEILDLANRLLENATHTFTWDEDGNMTWKVRKSDGFAQRFHWDAENQLVQVEVFANGILQPRTSLIAYCYDPLGRRFEKDVGGVVTRYVYDIEDILL